MNILTEEEKDGILADDELCQFITTGQRCIVTEPSEARHDPERIIPPIEEMALPRQSAGNVV